jgi:hypothetical protein
MRTTAGFFASGLTGVVVGALLVWVRVGHLLERAGKEPADVFDGYDPEPVGEETVEVRTADPESVEVDANLGLPEDFGTGMWPVTETSRLDLLEGETVRIRVPGARIEGEPVTEAAWAWLTRYEDPDRDWLKLTRTQEMKKIRDGAQ